MATSNRFTKCKDPNDVDVELKKLLRCEYLHEESCKDNFTKFKLNCRKHLKTPAEKQLSNPDAILEKLRAKSIISYSDYGELKNLVEDIDVEIVTLIKEAEERIKRLEEESDSPKSKRRKIDDVSLKDDVESINNLRQRLIKINNDMTKVTPLSPLLERGEDELPIEQLYAQVVIQEDPKYKEKGHDSSHSSIEVTDPDDIFTKDGEAVKKIFMTGDSGRGKTTFCLWLLKNWCNAPQKDGSDSDSDSEELDKWEKKLKEFDYVFLIQLGDFNDVQTNVASVIDMICHVVFESDTDHHATIRHVLSSNQYRSLIIIDGLDEWNPNEETRKHLIYDRMPLLDVSSTVSCFIAMRPWVLSIIPKIVKNSARIIEVFGLNEAGIKKVIKNVLINRYKLKGDPTKCTEECRNIVQHFSEKNLESFMQIPLLTVVCVQMLYEKKQLGDSMTSFYAEMLNMLIERANEKHKNLQIGPGTTLGCNLPKVLSKHKAVKNCTSVLVRLGKLAYECLLSNETNIVLQKIELEEQISEKELQFILNVGFISKKEASSRTKKKVSISFFHKSIQEFLAAVHIITNKEVGDSFCERLSDVDVIMESSNVIMFICGMCPSRGSEISQHVVSVTDNHFDTFEHKNIDNYMDDRSVRDMYKLQVCWYRELQDRQTDNPVKFYISNIFLLQSWEVDCKETVRVFKEVLSDHHVYARSLFLSVLHTRTDTEHNINKILSEFLSNKYNNTKSLVNVCIGKYNSPISGYCISTICIPSLTTLQLIAFETNSTHLESNVCTPLLKNMTSLQALNLWYMKLGGRGLDLSNMTSLQELKLSEMYLGERGLDLPHMKSLQKFELFNVNLGERGLDLSNQNSLQKLKLNNTTLGDRGLDLSNMKSLQKLSLGWMILGERGLDLSNMKSLQKLKLYSLNLVERGLDLSNMKSLQKLSLDSVNLSERGLDLSKVKSLQNLSLDRVNLSESGLDLSNMKSLQKVELRNIPLGERGLDLSNMKSLQKLSLCNVNLGERGLDLSNMKSLQKLTLDKIPLGDRGLDLSNMKSLQTLELSDLTLGDRGLDLSNMTSLCGLMLYDVNLGDRGLDLSDMTSLCCLTLDNVNLGDRGLDLSDMTSLWWLKLVDVNLHARGLDLSAYMVHIKVVYLNDIYMSKAQWQKFIVSVLTVQHSFEVRLKMTNIDKESETRIRSSPEHFKVTNLFETQISDFEDSDSDSEYGEYYECYKLCFKRVLL